MKRHHSSFRHDIVLAGTVLVVAGVAIAFVVLRNPGNRSSMSTTISPQDTSREKQDVAERSPTVRPEALPPPTNPTPSPMTALPPLLDRSASAQIPASKTAKVQDSSKTAKQGASTKPRVVAAKNGPDRPIARQALDLVGADPVAEAIWAQAINDPTVSAHDRQDLIEDLNENGFDDPKNPTADDLPLIENRLAIIEELAPLAMDDVNAAAFAEAYKDLVNMYAKAVAD